MEKQLLPNVALKPAYSQIVWLYVFRDFSNSPADRAAERVSLRFGLTSWPQHLLVDPRTLQVIDNTGRTVTSFLAAVNRAGGRVRPAGSSDAADRVKAADARALQLEQNGSVALARKLLDDPDVVVRYRALSILAKEDPPAVAARAPQLLLVPNDPFRYEVCKVMAATGDRRATLALESLVRKPVNSRNPNVLRINAVKALGTCGGRASVDVIAPFAGTGEYLNGLTRISVDALAAIGTRDPSSKSAVCAALKQSFPAPPKPADATRVRICVALAKQVHAALEKVTGRQVDFPEVYDQASRRKLIASW